MEDKIINKSFANGLKALANGVAEYLCIQGSYGQGKSHILSNLRKLAESQGYATSFVQLDLREITFHQFAVVYHVLMKNLVLPNDENFTTVWKKCGKKYSLAILNMMPHRFQMVLMAMLYKNHKDSADLLDKALTGHEIPVMQLKKIFKDQDLDGYKKKSLMCQGNIHYVQMVQELGCLLQKMGCKGLVLFFDEAESIAQGRISQRTKSYEILDQIFKTKDFIYPIFAFTADFFDKVNNEQYYDEKQTFAQNYAENWKNLNIVKLQDFSADSWDSLQNRLIQLYTEAYRIDISSQIIEIKAKLQNLLEKIQAQETRFKLKALVNQLDIETQHL